MVGADHVGLLVCNAFNVSISRENIRKDLRFVETVLPTAAPAVSARWLTVPHARQAFGGDDRARLESTRDRAHVISSGMDVLFTVKGCGLRMRRAQSDRVLTPPCAARMQDSEELLSLSGALLEEGTGSLAYLQQHTAGAPDDADGEAAGDDDEEERRRRKRERRAARAAAAAAAAEAAAPEEEPAAAELQDAPRAEAGGSRKRKKGRDASPDEPPAEAEAEPEKARKHKKKHKTDRHRDDDANGGLQ